MSRSVRSWSFEKAARAARKALSEADSFEANSEYFRERVSQPGLTPQVLAGCLTSSVLITRWLEAVVLAEELSGEAAWKAVHLVWRYHAIDWRIYLDRATHLAEEFPEKLKRGRLGIGLIDAQSLAAILMTMAFAAAIGEDGPASWFGDRCVRLVADREGIVKPNGLDHGYTHKYLLRLYALWRGIDLDPDRLALADAGPFEDVFQSWSSPAELEGAVLRLCRMHAGKAADLDKPDDDLVFGLQTGLLCEYPAEIIFLQRIRRELGLSVPNPDHPILRTPFMQMPFPCPKSGRDWCVDEVYGRCKALMPELRIEWEDELAG